MAAAGDWYLVDGGRPLGPFGIDELSRRIAAGTLGAHDLVWRAGFTDWVQAHTVPGLFAPPPVPPTNSTSPSPVLRISSSEERSAPAPMPETVTPSSSGGSKRSGYIARHWRGDLSLPQAYWVNGFLLNMLLTVVVLSSSAYLENTYSPKASILLLVLLPVIPLIIIPWQVVGIWKSANRHTKRGGRGIWAILAQIAVLFGVLRAVAEWGGLIPVYSKIIAENSAEDPQPRANLVVSSDGTVLTVEGFIGSGLSKRFDQVLAKNPGVRVVQLNSIGGWVKEGHGLGKSIRANALITVVDRGCFSACTLAFLGGKERWITDRGRLGFHAPHRDGLTSGQLADLIAQERTALRGLGVPEEFASRAMATSHESMWYPKKAELKQNKIITHVGDSDAFSRSSSLLPVDYNAAAVKALEKIPLYPVIRQTHPDTYRQVIARISEAMAKDEPTDALVQDLQGTIKQLVRRSAPRAADDVVLAMGAITLDYLRQFSASDVEGCVAFADPSKSKKAADVTKFTDVHQREIIINTRAIESASKSSIIAPSESDVKVEFDFVGRKLASRSNIKMHLFDKAVIQPSEFRAYCELNIAFMEEILALPRQNSVRFLRYLFNSIAS